MERRRALAIAGALTITLLTGTVAAGAVGGFFGFSPLESGASPAENAGPTAEPRPTVAVHVPAAGGDQSTPPPASGRAAISSPRTAVTPPSASPSPAPAPAVAPAPAPAAASQPAAQPIAADPASPPADDDEAEPEDGEDGEDHGTLPGDDHDEDEHDDERDD
jgi:hypothetical protein